MADAAQAEGVVLALGEAPIFAPGATVRVETRSPIGHYRVPVYLRGRTGVVVAALEPTAVDNEEEGFGRNAGMKRHYYRVAFQLRDLWPAYVGSPRDEVRIEVFESWLKGNAHGKL